MNKFIMIFLLMGLSIFSNNVNVDDSLVNNNDSFSINSEVIKVNGYDLCVPQVEYDSKEKTESINKLIKENIQMYFSEEGITTDVNIDEFVYSIEKETNNQLSILFSIDYYLEGAAHPNKSAFAINIDSAEEKLIDYKTDVDWTVFEEVSLVHKIKRENELIDDGGMVDIDDKKTIVRNINDYNYYLTDDEVGIIFEVPYACGGYSIYETDSK